MKAGRNDSRSTANLAIPSGASSWKRDGEAAASQWRGERRGTSGRMREVLEALAWRDESGFEIGDDDTVMEESEASDLGFGYSQNYDAAMTESHHALNCFHLAIEGFNAKYFRLTGEDFTALFR
ncbi:uncharacterized protein HKW66_Vig0149780 [Vigna angularis]|uniref:Uncharacterized protein n=1 Tax=Phaseolus angularis TaxID=3914 RepID=A0A8T0JU95_PHAAN|nr:uncharacterized protein HKW66_Vig0149780 [Vigna angularis]